MVMASASRPALHWAERRGGSGAHSERAGRQWRSSRVPFFRFGADALRRASAFLEGNAAWLPLREIGVWKRQHVSLQANTSGLATRHRHWCFGFPSQSPPTFSS
jgi:hypothetical protein